MSIKSASLFSLKAKQGSVCYNLLVAEHGFVSTGYGTHLYHLPPPLSLLPVLRHFADPITTCTYAVSSACSHTCSLQYLCRITFGIPCCISNTNHLSLGLSLKLSFESHRNVSLTVFNETSTLFQSHCPCIILLHHIRFASSATTEPTSCFHPL